MYRRGIKKASVLCGCWYMFLALWDSFIVTKKEESNPLAGIIGGAVTAVFVVLCAALSLIIYVRSKRRQHQYRRSLMRYTQRFAIGFSYPAKEVWIGVYRSQHMVCWLVCVSNLLPQFLTDCNEVRYAWSTSGVDVSDIHFISVQLGFCSLDMFICSYFYNFKQNTVFYLFYISNKQSGFYLFKYWCMWYIRIVWWYF